MKRRPSPRPAYDRPTPIRREEATLHLWGDDESGFVSDRIYVSSDKVHLLELTFPSGQRFQHSENNRTFFAADEVFFVLDGTLALANPESGEVHRIETGQAAFFRRDTWHHGFSIGERPVLVLEYLCPPPAQGTTSSYALKHENLTRWRYTDDAKLGRWPMDAPQWHDKHAIRVLRDEDIAWRLEGPHQALVVGLVASTEHLTAGRASLLPAKHSGVRTHRGDTAIYVTRGQMQVLTPDDGPPSWFEIGEGDGFYIPEGHSYELYNFSGSVAEFLFGTAPEYQAID